MIFDKLTNLEKYKGINKNLDIVIDYVKKTDFSKFEFGDHKIDDNNFFKKVDQACYDIDDAPYELHKIYADIHFILNGDSELVGFRPGNEIEEEPLVSEGEDVRFIESDIHNIMELTSDKFALFMPGEGHAPKISNGKSEVTKIICKVKW